MILGIFQHCVLSALKIFDKTGQVEVQRRGGRPKILPTEGEQCLKIMPICMV